MPSDQLEITPSTTVHNLLEVYPELAETLIDIAPPFAKLNNPLLRKSIAKIATIKHISSVGDIPLNELVAKLREAVGQPVSGVEFVEEDYYAEKPDWFSEEKIAVSFVEAEIEDKSKMTVVHILQAAKSVGVGEIIELTTTFLPAPGIDTMKSKGYSVWTLKEDGGIHKTYFLKN